MYFNFGKKNVCLKPVSWHSIYIRAERDHRLTIVIVNFKYMTPCSSVSTVDFEHVFIFWVWSFNISIIFRIRWTQIPFIYRKDFLEVKYLHEVACTAPCLIFFKNFSKFQNWSAQKKFFRTASINYSRAISRSKSLLPHVQGGIIQGKMFERQKSRGKLPYGKFHGGNCTGENYSGVIVRGQKSRE